MGRKPRRVVCTPPYMVKKVLGCGLSANSLGEDGARTYMAAIGHSCRVVGHCTAPAEVKRTYLARLVRT